MCLIHFIPRYDAANYNCCGLCLLLALYFIFPFFVNAFHRQIPIRNRDIIEDDAFSWMFVCIQPFRVRQMTVETHFRTPTNLPSTKLKYILVPPNKWLPLWMMLTKYAGFIFMNDHKTEIRCHRICHTFPLTSWLLSWFETSKWLRQQCWSQAKRFFMPMNENEISLTFKLPSCYMTLEECGIKFIGIFFSNGKSLDLRMSDFSCHINCNLV